MPTFLEIDFDEAERARKLAIKDYMLVTDSGPDQYISSCFVFNPENPRAYFDAIGLKYPGEKYWFREPTVEDIQEVGIWVESQIEPGRVPDGYWASINYWPHLVRPAFAADSFDNAQEASAAYLTWPPAQYAA